MTKLFCILLTLISVGTVSAQTRQITPEEWRAMMRGTPDFPSNPVPGVPHRMTFWSNSFEQGDVEYERTSDGGWKRNPGGQGQYRLGRRGTDYTKPGPSGEPPPVVRKPASEEVLHFALGERPYKREMVSVYEEVTRHVIIKLADRSEVHYENRTRYWFAAAGRMIRVDRNYVIYSDSETTRILSGYEWENDPAIKPVEIPTID